MKCIEDEIPFELPKSWAWARIVSISEEIFAGGDKPEKFSKEQNSECKYAIYSNGVENDGLYGFTDVPRVAKPSITVSGRGTIGFSCVRYDPFFPIIRLITITPSSLISLKFLDFVFKRLLETGTGSSIPQLTVPMVKPKLIPIPPIKEQEKIVVIAESFLEQIKFIDINEENKDCIASTGFYVCNSNGALYPRFMYYLMISEYVVQGLNQFMKGDNSPSIKNKIAVSFLAFCSKFCVIHRIFEF